MWNTATIVISGPSGWVSRRGYPTRGDAGPKRPRGRGRNRRPGGGFNTGSGASPRRRPVRADPERRTGRRFAAVLAAVGAWAASGALLRSGPAEAADAALDFAFFKDRIE